MRRHLVKGADAACAHRLSDVLDLGCLAVERPAHHQEGAFGAEPVQLLDDGLRGMAPEHHLVHRAEYDPALVHGCPPGTFLLCPKLAEEICGVMPEDRPPLSFRGSRCARPGMTS